MPSDGFAAASRTLGLPASVDEDGRQVMVSSLFGALAVLAIGVLDALTGELRLSVLYVIVIMMMTWRNGRTNGLVFAAASGLALVLANTA
ncbi:MAG: hypothetical protein JO128_09175, partial [Alphaproteobacteria bacterium]|nr:hypothetical protein [Alphaproteobacteria bacterium]